MKVVGKKEIENKDLADFIKSHLNLVDVASLYWEAPRRKGKTYFIHCPFHSDSEPSCALYEEHFHCYGCNASGDVINFVERLYNLSFSQASLKLIDDFNLSLPQRLKGLVEGLQRSQTQGGQYLTTSTTSKASLTALQQENQGGFRGGLSSYENLRGAPLEELKDYIGLQDDDWKKWLLEKAKVEERELKLRERIIKVLVFPYFKRTDEGKWIVWKRRLRLQFPHSKEEDKGFRWAKDEGRELIPYGLHSITINPHNPYLFLVEGETDCLSLWRIGFPAVGLPGLWSWRPEWIDQFIKPIFRWRIIILVREIVGSEKEDEKVKEKVKEIFSDLWKAGYYTHLVNLYPFKDIREWRLNFIEKEKREPKDTDLLGFLFSDDVEITSQEDFYAWKSSWLEKEKILNGGVKND